MLLRLHPEANTELAAAFEWYERQQLGLGAAFSSAVFRALDAIEESPETWPEWPGVHHTPPIRRLLLPDFPFAVPYMVLEDRVVVLAVTHVRRRPGYWLKRIRQLRTS
ncbi:type II toxin-antitoxin system RelE/ParE family toxin [Archangium sp.]|jgi:toxin ParE1/3/4|uniref:type II toxin-antitoxin system RelE/ParE family toxin n=1 Tax=Archangium sp. TaxID=1872627 RepID=UPI00389AD7D9